MANRRGILAGYIRNVQMAGYAEALIAIRKNNSKGTTHMINIANSIKLKTFVKDIQ